MDGPALAGVLQDLADRGNPGALGLLDKIAGREIAGGLLDAARVVAINAAEANGFPGYVWPAKVQGFTVPRAGVWRGARNDSVRPGWESWYSKDQLEAGRA